MRILYVDDDDTQRDCVRRGFAAEAGGWTLHAESATAPALASLDRGGIDAVVVDMHLPHAEGLQVLRRARTVQPDAIRIVCAESDDREAATLALDLAHQCLPHCGDVALMIEAIGRVAALRTLLRGRELRRVMGQVERLPSAPRMYMRLRGLLGDPECHGRAVSATLAEDPGLTAKVLQVANSAYFNLGAPIVDIPQAVFRIGLDALRTVVLANEVFDAHRGPAAASMRDRALRASLLAARIAGGTEREAARTAALLAEAGHLVPGVEALCAAETAGTPGMDVTPAEVGAYLLGLWGLPMSLVEAVAHHRRPGRVPQRRFGVLGAVHVAVALASGREPDLAYLRQLGIEAELPRWRGYGEGAAEGAADAPLLS